MKYKKLIAGVVLLVIIALQALLVLGTYVSEKFQIDDGVNELSGNVINNVHKMVDTLAIIIVINWVIIGILFIIIVVMQNRSKEKLPICNVKFKAP